MVELLTVPSDIGKGGANLGDGSPKLAEILIRMTEAVAELQSAPGGGSYFMVTTQGGDGTGGPINLPTSGAVAGDEIVNWLRLDATAAGGRGGFADKASFGEKFETAVSTTGQIKQTAADDLNPFWFIFLLKR